MIDNFSYELFSIPKFESVIISISVIHNIVYKKTCSHLFIYIALFALRVYINITFDFKRTLKINLHEVKLLTLYFHLIDGILKCHNSFLN